MSPTALLLDQSITRLPALKLIQAGHESGQNAMFQGPGLFHMNIAGALSTHFGKPDTSLCDPDSFPYENTHLDSTEGEKTPLTESLRKFVNEVERVGCCK